jgi:Zn-dependent protease with chaperone function
MAEEAVPISGPLAAREERHRRWVLLGLASLILLSISPVVGHHLIGAVAWLPSDIEHVGIFCIVTLHELLAPLHELFHGLLYAGIVYATFDRAGAAWKQRRMLALLTSRRPAPHEPIARAAQLAGLPIEQTRIVVGLPNQAFTTGWFHPRVYVAAELANQLADSELEAVLAHECAHVIRRDPLRLFVLRFFAGVLFWIPALRRLTEDWADEAEISADDAAARTHALPLASAMLVMASSASHAVVREPSVGFQSADLLERRIRRLAGEEAVVGTHVSWRTLSGAAAALVLVWTSGIIVLHPLQCALRPPFPSGGRPPVVPRGPCRLGALSTRKSHGFERTRVTLGLCRCILL